MASQAAGNGRIDETAAAVGGNVANLASDLVSLAELQAKLAALDLREAGAQAMVPAGVLTGGMCLLLGTIPVLLLGISGAVANTGVVSPAGAMLLVSLVALAMAGGGIWYGYNNFKSSLIVLNRSREEFEANLRWIKKAMQSTSNSARS